MPASTEAAESLLDQIGDGLSGFDYGADEAMGETDCPDGCHVEPDGVCCHGWKSAALTAGLI